MSAFKVLFIDDEESLRLALTRVFALKGYKFFSASRLQAAKELMASERDFDLVLLRKRKLLYSLASQPLRRL
jgi:DNA-binding NtrC family response regulator